MLTPETSRHLLCTSSECLKFWPPLTVALARDEARARRRRAWQSRDPAAQNGMLAGHAERAAAVSLRRGPRERRSQRPELRRLRRDLARAGRLRRPQRRRADERQRPAPSTPTTSTPTTTTPTTSTPTTTTPTTSTPSYPHRLTARRARRRAGAAPGRQSSARRRSSGSACASTRCSGCREVLGDRPRQPALAVAAVGRERRATLLGQLDQDPPPVGRDRRGARSGRRPRGRRSSGSSTAGARARRPPDRRSTCVPSRSRRPSTAPCESGKRCSARRRRISWPSTMRSSLARRVVSTAWPRRGLYSDMAGKLLSFLYNLIGWRAQ